MWLPGSSPFIAANKGTALLSLWWLPLRCLPACARGCAAWQLLLLLLLHGGGPQQGWLWGSSPGAMEQVCTPQKHACSEKSSCTWKCAPTCPTENPSRKQEKGGSLLPSIAFHIPHFFTSDPEMGQRWHNSETEKPVQHYARNPPFGPCCCMLTSCQGPALHLCAALMTIKLFF